MSVNSWKMHINSSLVKIGNVFIGACVLLIFLHSASVCGAPNVLLVITDDMNTRLGIYGDRLVKTPYLHALTQRGVRFDHAYVQFPQCNQSRSSLMTGLYPDQNGVTRNSHHFRNVVPEVKTLPQVFQDSGYYTARVGKIFHYGVPQEIGTDGFDDPGSWDERFNPIGVDRTHIDQVHYIGARPTQKREMNAARARYLERTGISDENIYGGWLSWMRVGGSADDHTDGKVTNRALDILENKDPRKTHQPFFLAVGYYRPHVPFSAPERFFDLYPIDDIPLDDSPEGDRTDIPVANLLDRPYQTNMNEEQKKRMIQAYFASISFIDEQVGRLMQGLKKLDLLDSTIVVFVSDHGFLLGEHGLWQKPSLFEETLRTPLVISAPGRPAMGKTSQSLVELIDLYPTLLDLAGIAIPAHIAGRSFARLLDEPSHTVRNSALSQSYSATDKLMFGYSIRTRRFRYTEWGDGIHGAELYDHKNDPGEHNNLYANPHHVRTRAELTQLLKRRVLQAREPRLEL